MFNIDGGYLEGLCRGFKCGILKQSDYLNLVQCETLEGRCSAVVLFRTALVFANQSHVMMMMIVSRDTNHSRLIAVSHSLLFFIILFA